MTTTVYSAHRSGGISEQFSVAAREFADREAVICGDVRLTYHELTLRVDRLPAGLSGLGVRSGTCVAVLAKNCHRYQEIYLAEARLGAVLVPLNYRVAARELQEILADSGAQVILVGPTFTQAWRTIRDKLPAVSRSIVLTEASDDEMIVYEKLIQTSTAAAPEAERSPDDLRYLLYSRQKMLAVVDDQQHPVGGQMGH
jgi:fatty-acyl-CoA synthase